MLAWDSTSGRGWTRPGQPGRGSHARCRPAAAAASPSTPTPPAAGKGGQSVPGHPQTCRTSRGDGGDLKPSYKGCVPSSSPRHRSEPRGGGKGGEARSRRSWASLEALGLRRHPPAIEIRRWSQNRGVRVGPTPTRSGGGGKARRGWGSATSWFSQKVPDGLEVCSEVVREDGERMGPGAAGLSHRKRDKGFGAA